MINWDVLASNKNICQLMCPLDYQKMKKNNYIFLEELCSQVFNPNRLNRIAKLYNISLNNLLEYY